MGQGPTMSLKSHVRWAGLEDLCSKGGISAATDGRTLRKEKGVISAHNGRTLGVKGKSKTAYGGSNFTKCSETVREQIRLSVTIPAPNVISTPSLHAQHLSWSATSCRPSKESLLSRPSLVQTLLNDVECDRSEEVSYCLHNHIVMLLSSSKLSFPFE